MSNVIQFQDYRARNDGFKNLTTGYGTPRDHGMQYEWYERAELSKVVRDGLYAQHPIAWKLVDYLPDNAIREWVDYDHDRRADITLAMKNVSVVTTKGHKRGYRHVLKEGLKNALKDGMGALYVIHQGADPTKPLNWKNPGRVASVEVIEADYISIEPSTNINPISRSLNHTRYLINGFPVHKDHLIILQGKNVGRDWMIKRGGKCQSALERSFIPLLFYSISHGMVPNILKDFIRDIIKIDGLTDLAAMDCDKGAKAFQDRLDYMFQAQSLINKLVLDKNDEYIRQTTNVSGINDLIRNPEKYLVASSGHPHTVLLGESPGGGIGNKGESQKEIENKFVSAYQEDEVLSPIEEFLMHLSPELGIKDDIPVFFNPLDTPTKKENAEMFDIVSKGIERLVSIGTISVEESRTMLEGSEIKTTPILNDESAAALAALKGDPDDDKEQSEVSTEAES